MINQRHAILHTIDTTGPGGAETVFLDLVEHLSVDGFDNIAIIKGPGWVEEQLKARGIRYYIVNPHGPFSLSYYWELYRLLRHHNVKLVQAHLLGSTLTYSLLSILLRIPLVATLHGQVDVNPTEKRVYLKNRLMRLGVNRLIAVSQGLADYIANRGLFSKERIGVIYNGVNMGRYGPNRLTALRKALNLDESAVLVGSVGNIRPAKAYDVLIEAAKSVCKRHGNVHFVVAGHQKSELMYKVEGLLEQHNLQERVHFIGFHENTAEFLGQLDLFALSSSSEGFSIATIEAMATGLPVVVTRCGGPEEIVVDRETGLMVPTNDPHALADQIETLIDNPKLAKELGAAGKRHARQSFSMDTLLEEYREEYLKLLRRVASAGANEKKPEALGHSNKQH